MGQRIKKIILVMIAIYTPNILAGPPFITNDPEPTDFKHWEIYFFSAMDKNSQGFVRALPAVEVNYGILHRVQIGALFPVIYNAPNESDEPDDESLALGAGDIQLELKYAFIKENKTRPQVAIDPTIFIPVGDYKVGLGNGRLWWALPIWLQKTWDKWTVYGGGGYAVNRAPGERNFFFGGVVTEYDVTDKWMVGGEIFTQGADSTDAQAYALFNLGTTYSFTKIASFLFSIGHSFVGEKHFVSYIALGLNI